MEIDTLTWVFVVLGALFLVGLATDLLGHLTRLPRVTLLLLFGFLVGPSGIALLKDVEAPWVDGITTISLVMVGFLLGEKLTTKRMRDQGRLVLTVSILVTVTTILVVLSGLLLIGVDMHIAMLLAAMATATAPAATIDVVREAKASGRFTSALLAIVAIDDIWGLLAFSMTLTFLLSITNGGTELTAITHGLMDVGGAIALGLGLGIPMSLLTGRLRPGEPTQAEALGFVFLCAGLALWFDVSFILAAMVMGMAVANLAEHHNYPFHEIEGIEWPFLILFFILAGASLHVETVAEGGMVLAVYIGLRIVGRVVGGWLGGSLAGANAGQKRWFGVALLPQAGVAIGMALLGAQRFPEYGEELLSIAIASTVVFELLGPVFTRQALVRQGEAGAQKGQ